MIDDISSSWPIARSVPALAPSAVHIWCWHLRMAQESVQGFRSVLSPEECVRADRFVFDRDRLRYIAAHARMRQILSHYLAGHAREIVFRADARGKPEIAGNTDLRFNLSHSNDLALLAVARGVEVGVDVELMRPVSEDIAKHFFSSPEQEALRSLRGRSNDWLKGFYSCWTRKEAFLKGVGLGLSAPLDSFAVSLVGNGPPMLHSVPLGGTDVSGWTLDHLEPAPGYVGALAIKSNCWSALYLAIPSGYELFASNACC